MGWVGGPGGRSGGVGSGVRRGLDQLIGVGGGLGLGWVGWLRQEEVGGLGVPPSKSLCFKSPPPMRGPSLDCCWVTDL